MATGLQDGYDRSTTAIVVNAGDSTARSRLLRCRGGDFDERELPSDAHGPQRTSGEVLETSNQNVARECHVANLASMLHLACEDHTPATPCIPGRTFACSTGELASVLIRRKARRLLRSGRFARSDREDVEQELRTHLWRQAAKFDPAIASWEKFVSFILDKRCVSLIRQRTAEKRNPRREECSLNDTVLDADGRVVDRHQVTPEASVDFRSREDLRSDLSHTLRGRISDEAWLVARGLVESNLTEIAREQGWSRAKAGRHLKELREACEDLGLRDYLA